MQQPDRLTLFDYTSLEGIINVGFRPFCAGIKQKQYKRPTIGMLWVLYANQIAQPAL